MSLADTFGNRLRVEPDTVIGDGKTESTINERCVDPKQRRLRVARAVCDRLLNDAEREGSRLIGAIWRSLMLAADARIASPRQTMAAAA